MDDIHPTCSQDQKSNDWLAKCVLFTLLFYGATMLWTTLVERLDPDVLYLLRFMHGQVWTFWVWTVASLSLVIRSVFSWWATKYIWSLGKAVTAGRSSMVRAIADLSKQGPTGPPQTLTSPDSTQVVPERVEPQNSCRPGEKKKSNPFANLPAKTTNYARYLDGSNLTDMQYQVGSPKWEYRLPIAEIARRLGRHRSTIDECLAAAQKKVDEVRGAELRAAKRSVHPE